MDQLSPEMVAEFPERGMQWVKDRVETVVNETGEYMYAKSRHSRSSMHLRLDTC